MIIAVTCAVVAAMVIAGVLVGVKFFLDSTNDLVKVKRYTVYKLLVLIFNCLTDIFVAILRFLRQHNRPCDHHHAKFRCNVRKNSSKIGFWCCFALRSKMKKMKCISFKNYVVWVANFRESLPKDAKNIDLEKFFDI